eukprot:TRINITY_DN4660_c0_g1_i1.p1 TRINITY_DN4660_c0_g1~~TRINITY_DN4660_c0_g1_i1.p1  ORF type:complete len:152 (-),score=16.53 TRINITY_DN4660_c0_g1_i1:46-501(-)
MSIPPHLRNTYVVPVDDSGNARAAFQYALKMSSQHDRILLFHAHGEALYADCEGTILSIPQVEEDKRNKAFELKHMQECRAQNRDCIWVERQLLAAKAISDEICDIARSERAGNIIMGTRSRSTVAGLVLGSVSQGVLHCADSPVTIVKPE